MKKTLFCVAGMLFAAQPTLAAQKAHAVAHMKALAGSAVGTIDFGQSNRGTLITFDLHGLSPGAHAVHIHTSGNCDAKVKFTSAGPHFPPDPKMHGFMVKGGPHPGDLPNQWAAADGTLHASITANSFSLGNGKKSVFDRDGAAIIIH